ncbi:ATP-dependent DNA helicase RecQ [Roseimaritima ulvae]|uniref:ATP-dependent DNA helicase RecQ n=2 Tax=Roseimaritima ulvae TaxID=980254 RepID=A0A5B9QQC9_9BACT|nr:ATP-dependent DNA helicase RecQ [Roseimaritima ulvae]
MNGRDTLILLPTGSGKSLCYQLPGLELDGVTVVVSPLISLAEDQANSLRELGIEAVILNSSRSAKQIKRFRNDLRSGKAEFVFTTPERLQKTDLCELLCEVGVDMLVIDEAHCVSQWGHDFRPDYLCLRHVRQRLADPPILAMTATASPRTIDEIVSALRLSSPVTVCRSPYRENLRLSVVPCDGEAQKVSTIRELLTDDREGFANEPAIVYCNTIKNTERLVDELSDLEVPVLMYHGRMNKRLRQQSQQAFMDGPPAVIVATNAFGLGIDKPDIRRVIHYSLPGSLEAYYQEVGRAGRDGKHAQCTMLFDPEDLSVLKMFAGGHMDSSKLATAHHCLLQASQHSEADDGTVSMTDLIKTSPFGRQTLKNCLHQLAARGLVAPAGRGRWRSIVDDIDHDVTDRIAADGRSRAEDRQIALQQMVQFAQKRACRWTAVLKHFDDDQADELSDCRCDVCEPVSDSIDTPVEEPLPT